MLKGLKKINLTTLLEHNMGLACRIYRKALSLVKLFTFNIVC
jgi:hypothetical protein